MKVKDMIKQLQEYDENANISIDFKYYDSDEGKCYGSFDSVNFKYEDNKYVTIYNEDY